MMNEYYDHHPNDSRVTGPHTVANSVCARYGTGGGNTPLVLHSESKERGEHSAESKRTECRGSSDYETNQRKVGALCAVDYKQVQSQMVEAGKLILVPVTR